MPPADSGKAFYFHINFHFRQVTQYCNKTLESTQALWYSVSLVFFTGLALSNHKNGKELVQMTSKKHRMIVYGVAVQLLLIAIVCYAAFPVKAPEQPIRLMYHTNAGKVFFDHQTHSSVTGYGLSCTDCHHHPPDDDKTQMACSSCHPAELKEGETPASCLDCHDASEVEDSEYPKLADAFHQQCQQCHEQFGKGPGSGPQNCSKCHVL